jgi:glutathione S-transferase
VAASPSSVPQLYHFRISHYNEKVRWALDHKRWPHRRTALVPGFHGPRAFFVSRQTALPILVLDGRTILDSTRIIAEIERLRPDPPLYPADPAERARALAIEDHFDEVVAPDLRRLFWATYIEQSGACSRMSADGAGPVTRALFRVLFPLLRPLFRSDMDMAPEDMDPAGARRRFAAHLDRLEAEIGPSGYLVGERFTIADLAAAAVMTAIIRPPGFPYPLPEPWPAALVDLRASAALRPGFRWVLDMYARHRSPSAEIGAAAD